MPLFCDLIQGIRAIGGCLLLADAVDKVAVEGCAGAVTWVFGVSGA
jgi:hypothetical protein